MQVTRFYEVLAFLPGRGDLAEVVNGQPWRGGGDPYPNLVVFRPFQSFPARDFLDLVHQLRTDTYVTGTRYEARFLPIDADALLRHVLSSAQGVAPAVNAASFDGYGQRDGSEEEETAAGSSPTSEVSTTQVRDVPIEAHRVETFQRDPGSEPTIGERREAALVERYTAWLEAAGHVVTRKEITIAGYDRPFYTDLFDGSRSELVEAKSVASRNEVRLAIGQLYDYGRFLECQSRAVLLPSRPEDDLLNLLHGVGIACVYQDKQGGFLRADPA